jgi:serine/threonine protein kinase
MDDITIPQELKILREIKDAQCIHLPELVWEPEGERMFSFVPMGKPINFQQTADVSRNIVYGLVDRLQHLHKLEVVHRDIQPANLILDHKNNVVIIDYETSVSKSETVGGVEYYGGLICWPQ